MSVEPADVGKDMGVASPTQTQLQQWQGWIDEALYLIDREYRGQGGHALLDQDDVDYVVLRAVVDHARNPTRETQVDVAVDDGRVSRRFQSAPGRVTIGADLWAILEPAGSGSSGAFTISPSYVPGSPCR